MPAVTSRGFSLAPYNKIMEENSAAGRSGYQRSGSVGSVPEPRESTKKINVDPKQVKTCLKLLADPERRQWITGFLEEHCHKFDILSLTQEDDALHREVYKEWTDRIDAFFDESSLGTRQSTVQNREFSDKR